MGAPLTRHWHNEQRGKLLQKTSSHNTQTCLQPTLTFNLVHISNPQLNPLSCTPCTAMLIFQLSETLTVFQNAAEVQWPV